MLLPILALLAHGVWAWRTNVALRTRLAEIASRGEPVRLDELQRRPPDGVTNGFDDLFAAMAIAGQKTNALERFRDSATGLAIPMTADERQLLQAVIYERRAALPLIERAAKQGAIINTRPLTSPVIDMARPEIDHARAAANLLRCAAILAVDAGRHDEAIQWVSLIEPVARAIGSQDILAQLVAEGVRGVQYDTIMLAAPELRIGVKPGEANPQSVRTLIRSLEDQTALTEALASAFRGERVMVLDSFEKADRDITKGSSVKRYIVGPFLRTNILASVDLITEHIALLDAPDSVSYHRRSQRFDQHMRELRESKLKVMASMLAPSYTRVMHAYYRARTECNAAAVALAIRLYQADHENQRPSDLAALTPAYLTAMPGDALSNGSPLRYDRDRAILWSVGGDGIDNGGDETPVTNPADRDWKTRDIVFHLDRQPRAPVN